MAKVSFTPHLRRHLECPDVVADGATVREILDQVFRDHPRLRGYVLDDQGALRQHVVIFIDNRTISDRADLRDRVGPDSQVFVMQALSGG